ncbi:ABC1 kinase family protein [Acidilutibacter cellobiosedens]|jgi:ubiquinone biosynthesis protein|nr:AarF/UbiB family protein [Acidilutibacter cellobiosedens]
MNMDKYYTRDRLKEIISVFLKHGFKNNIRNPKEFRRALEDLGPTFVKIGQILSTRPDILPKEYIEELKNLQDNVKSEDFNVIKDIVEKELQKPIAQVFPYFEKKPLACASLSQVHLARTKSENIVAVKVQRPNVKEKLMADIHILNKLTPFINLISQGEVINAKEVIDELSDAAKKELNFLSELNNINRFNENNKDVKYMASLKAYKEYSTDKVLVMDYIEGIKIDNIKKLEEEGYDLKDIAEKLTYNYFKQIFEDGYFHADPHPGNILVSNKKIGYIDFGLMGELNKNLRKHLNEFLKGAASEDINSMANSVLKIGIKRGPVDINKFHSDIEMMYDKYIGESMGEYDLPQIMEEILKVCKSNNIAMPKDVALLAKSLMTIQGLLAKLDKDMNLIDIAEPYVASHIIQENLKEINSTNMLKYLYTFLKSNIELSPKVLLLINHALGGRMKLNLEFKNMENSISELNRMVNRLIFAIIVASLVVSSSLVINADIGIKIYNIPIIGLVGYLGAAIAGFWLLISILKSGKL